MTIGTPDPRATAVAAAMAAAMIAAATAAAMIVATKVGATPTDRPRATPTAMIGTEARALPRARTAGIETTRQADVSGRKCMWLVQSGLRHSSPRAKPLMHFLRHSTRYSAGNAFQSSS